MYDGTLLNEALSAFRVVNSQKIDLNGCLLFLCGLKNISVNNRIRKSHQMSPVSSQGICQRSVRFCGIASGEIYCTKHSRFISLRRGTLRVDTEAKAAINTVFQCGLELRCRITC